MCPSFRATRDEKDSTRGRANALRLALAGESPLDEFRSKWVYDVLDLCLMCKACKAECPSNVDMAKLKAEFLDHYYQAHSRPLGEKMLANFHRLFALAAPIAPFANWVNRRPITRWALEKLAGLDRRRSLPLLVRHTFRRWFARHRPPSYAGKAGKVILLDDCFMNFGEPDIGKAAVRVLERAGFAVELANITCCGRPMISKGFLTEAKALIRTETPRLSARIHDGTPILGLEPSCILTMADEWPELVPGSETRRIAGASCLADGWLARQANAQSLDLKLTGCPDSCVLHGHCHQKTLTGMADSTAALKLIPGLQVTTLDTGCCGMAGTFGYEKEHYDLSVSIANLSVVPELNKAPDSIVVAAGASCRHQIKDLAGRRALHPFELLSEQLS